MPALQNLNDQDLEQHLGSIISTTNEVSPSMKNPLTLEEEESQRIWGNSANLATGSNLGKSGFIESASIPTRPNSERRLDDSQKTFAANWYAYQVLQLWLVEQHGPSYNSDATAIHLQQLTRLVTFNPITLVTPVVLKLVQSPSLFLRSDLQEFEKAIASTEEWIRRIVSNPLFSIFDRDLPDDTTYAKHLRSLGAQFDSNLYLSNISSEYALIPGGSTLRQLKRVIAYTQELRSFDNCAVIQCTGLRQLYRQFEQVVEKRDPALTQMFANILADSIEELVSPLIDSTGPQKDGEITLNNRQSTTSEGLFRLISRRLIPFEEAIQNFSAASEVGAIVQLLAESPQTQVGFLTRNELDLALLSSEPQQSAVLWEILRETAAEERPGVFILCLKAVGVLELCLRLNKSYHYDGQKLLGHLEDLAAPASAYPRPTTLAQVLLRLDEQKKPGVVSVLIEGSTWLRTRFLASAPTNMVADFFAMMELCSKPGRAFADLQRYFDSGNLAQAQNTIEQAIKPPATKNTRKIATDVHPTQEDLPESESAPTTFSVTTPPVRLVDALPFICRIFSQSLNQLPQAQELFFQQAFELSSSSWFRTMLADSSKSQRYRQALLTLDPQATTQVFQQLFSPPEPEKRDDFSGIQARAELSSFRKILVCGGTKNHDRERKFLAELPNVEIQFAYADSGSRNFKNINKLMFNPTVLVLWICDQTGHSDCWRIWEMAEANRAVFLLIPKQFQNPARILDLAEQKLQG